MLLGGTISRYDSLSQDDSSRPFQSVQLDLFECEALMDEVGDTMCIVAAGKIVHRSLP